MIGPGLLPGVEQGCHFPGQWILSAGGAAFELVAAAAGKAEVFKDAFAILGLRLDVVYGHRLAGVGFSRVAVCAVAIVGLKQPIAQIDGKIAHWLQFVWWWNLMSAPLQQGRRVNFAQHLPVKVGAELGQFFPLLV
jgi:hypothetical protein